MLERLKQKEFKLGVYGGVCVSWPRPCSVMPKTKKQLDVKCVSICVCVPQLIEVSKRRQRQQKERARMQEKQTKGQATSATAGSRTWSRARVKVLKRDRERARERARIDANLCCSCLQWSRLSVKFLCRFDWFGYFTKAQPSERIRFICVSQLSKLTGNGLAHTHTHTHTHMQARECVEMPQDLCRTYLVNIYIHVQQQADSVRPTDIFDTLLMTVFLLFSTDFPTLSFAFSLPTQLQIFVPFMRYIDSEWDCMSHACRVHCNALTWQFIEKWT